MSFLLHLAGTITCAQQNTYDTAMVAENTFIGSYYVTALRATAAMATLMGDSDLATKYSDRAALSAQNYERICWRESFGYYIANVTLQNWQNSYGIGCFIDQVCAIGLSTATGLGYIFQPEHEQSCRRQIAANNLVWALAFSLSLSLYLTFFFIDVYMYIYIRRAHSLPFDSTYEITLE